VAVFVSRYNRTMSRSSIDPVIEQYKRSIDRTLLRENLRKTPDERVRQLQALQRFAKELHRAGNNLRKKRR
jgi:hypothetical protein